MESDSGGYRLAPDSKIELCYDYSFSLKIHPYNRSMRRELKKLFSEYGIAYWERRFIPVVKIDGRVAGLFPNYIDAEFYTPAAGLPVFSRIILMLNSTPRIRGIVLWKCSISG